MQKDYDTRQDHQVLLSKGEKGWNYALHTNNVHPHYQLFGIMPRFMGVLDEFPQLVERVALMKLECKKTECLRARDLISRALDQNRRHIVHIQSFSIHKKVWFHRHRR